MSFNNIHYTNRKNSTPQNKENLDTMVKRLSVENEAFSNRVKNLKRKIETVHDDLSSKTRGHKELVGTEKKKKLMLKPQHKDQN